METNQTTAKESIYDLFCTNDKTNVFEVEGRYFISTAHLSCKPTDKDKYFFSCPYLSFGDYDNSCHVERSNVRVFMEMYGSHPDVYKHTGSYGHEAIFIDVLCTDSEIIETLQALYNYPCIDDQDCSLMGAEMEEECWESYILSDFTDAIIKKYDLLDIEVTANDLFSIYRELQEATNTYFEVQSGGNGHIDIKRLIDGLPDICPTYLKPIFYTE